MKKIKLVSSVNLLPVRVGIMKEEILGERRRKIENEALDLTEVRK